LWNPISSTSQSPVDIAFIAFNTDDDKDFAIAALATIHPNARLYFSENDTDDNGSCIGGESSITWLWVAKTITAVTIIQLTDTYTNLNFRASIGTISRSSSFKISSFKEGIIGYAGTDADTPSTYLAAILIGNDHSKLGPIDPDGIPLTAKRLSITTIAVIDNVTAHDGGKYTDSKSSQIVFSNYLTSIYDKTK